MLPKRLFALMLAALPCVAAAGTYGTMPTGVAAIEVLPGWSENGERIAGIRIRLAPGWKTYWRAPGDTGIPPSFSWSGSSNLSNLQVHFPVPEVFYLNGNRSIGYASDVVFPLRLTPATPGEPVVLRGRIDLGVCHDVCLPVSFEIDTRFEGPGKKDSQIARALDSRPRTAAEAGLVSIRCLIEPIADGLRLTASIDLPKGRGEEVAVVEAGMGGIWASEAVAQRKGSNLKVTADLVPPQARPFALDRSAVRITLLTRGEAVDIQGCPD